MRSTRLSCYSLPASILVGSCCGLSLVAAVAALAARRFKHKGAFTASSLVTSGVTATIFTRQMVQLNRSLDQEDADEETATQATLLLTTPLEGEAALSSSG
jgi:nitrate reductase gamma subunit